MIIKQQRGERGATVIIEERPDGRFNVEVIGSDGVTEEWYENLDSKNAGRLFQDALERDTDAWISSWASVDNQ